jgi:archaetidylinositol phosphate synthase
VSVSTENIPAQPVRSREPRRAGRELLLEALFQPPANRLAAVLARVGVAPPAIVLANAATGLVAAVLLARGELVVAALLLQLKTLLDNADGQLARLSGRVTLVGRYLDTEADLVVNAAIFAALGYVTGEPMLAAASFVALTLVLAMDFNATELYREARGLTSPLPEATGGRTERALACAYELVFAHLDRLILGVSAHRLERIAGAHADPRRVQDARLAYVDRLTVTVLANLGLTTQLFVLGVCLVVGRPELYLGLVLACLAVLGVLHARAEARARAALNTPRAA